MDNITLGEIHQMALAALEKLCEMNNLFSLVTEQRLKFRKACKRSHIRIKCHEETCNCKSKIGQTKRKVKSWVFQKKVWNRKTKI